MSILISKQTKIICQGMTGKVGSFQSERTLAYGTQLVAGVTPGKGGQTHLGLPVFNTVQEARKKTGANVSIIYVPAPVAKGAIIEAADSGIELIVCITEGIPSLDMLQVKAHLAQKDVRLIGPNTPGIITPDECMLGIMPSAIFSKGHVGVVSRSGTLAYEVVKQITDAGFGQSTCIGIGGDGVVGTQFLDILSMFENDPETESMVIVGEIGGRGEEEAATYIAEHVTKPVVAYIAGTSMPKGKRMGHAGAIIAGNRGTAESKKTALREAGVFVVDSLTEIGSGLTRIADL